MPRLNHVYMIVNPRSGQLKIRGAVCDILNSLSAAGIDPTVHITQSKLDAENFIREKCKDADLVIICGGDGTLNEVINGIMTMPKLPKLGYIPAGTTNDFASTVGLKSDIMLACDSIIKGTEHIIDIGTFNQRKFVYIASFGAFTGSSYTAPQELKNSIGHLAYIYEGLRDMPNIRPVHMRITANGAIYEGDYVFGAISNSTSIGGIVKLDPATVKLDDGLFEFVMVKNPQSMIEMRELVIAVQTGDLDFCPLITMFKSNEAILTGDIVPWSLDGEYMKGEEQIKVMNMYKAISLIY